MLIVCQEQKSKVIDLLHLNIYRLLLQIFWSVAHGVFITFFKILFDKSKGITCNKLCTVISQRNTHQ